MIPLQRRATCCAVMLALGNASVSYAQAASGAAVEAEKKDEVQTVIVTGTVGATAAKAANVSFSVLDAKDLGKFTPMSADDYLRDMPGVVVESNEGVARNESFTRGMTIGTGSPTSGNFWTSILEDGLPVVPVKFNNFQDSNFYRADISTSRVESVRGGSTGTSVASSAGGVFNFMSGAIKPGSAIQTRIGVEGEHKHISWKQVDGYHGWQNEAGDLRASISGFERTSTGAVDPGYPLNLGGQVKLRVEKNYETAGGGSGRLSLTLKHLEDSNSWNGQFTTPVYGYMDPVAVPGFVGPDLFMHGSEHTVRTDAVDGPGSTRFHDPKNGATYKQDAIWLKWDHDTAGRWSFNSAIKAQDSLALVQQGFAGTSPTSLWDVATFQNAYVVNQGTGATVTSNLNRLPGYYELYDLDGGTVRARVNNNVGTASGVNYRTGKACPAGTATSPAQCVTYTNLPNANYDLAGGLVNGILVPQNNSVSNQDVVAQSGSNFGTRGSRDLMLSFMTTYRGDNFRLQAGVFAVQADQSWDTYFNGRGLTPFASGQETNLGVRYVTAAGTYQLSDEGGWAHVGGGNTDGATRFIWRSRQRDIQPMLGASWSPGKWDMNASYKGTYTIAHTHAIPLVTVPEATSATSRSYGGLDGNPLTWYDNQPYMRATPVDASKHVYLKNYSASVGYNLTPKDKVYYRHSKAGNNISGIVSRYGDQFGADNRPLFPQADLSQDEVAWVFGHGPISGQLTYYRTELLLWQQQTPLDVDGSSYVVEYLDHYVTKGLEASATWRVTPSLSWRTAFLYSKGHAIAVNKFSAGANGPQDDTLTVTSGNMSRTPPYVLSNTISYELGDFQFNLRHRYMSKRYRAVSEDLNVLPPQKNTDLSIQYVGIDKVRIGFEIRNLMNDKYISNYGTLLPGVTGVGFVDILQQLPNSAGYSAINPPRSFWLTARVDF
ncbi:MAG: TonB-dependent receptor plug domain-containing protein [Massilia sp.]